MRRRAASILLRAHRAIESITLDREVAHLKDDLMARYAEPDLHRLLVGAGAPEALQALIDQTQQTCEWLGACQTVQGQRVSVVSSGFEDRLAVRSDDCNLRG
jgi:argininosuccinate synthase